MAVAKKGEVRLSWAYAVNNSKYVLLFGEIYCILEQNLLLPKIQVGRSAFDCR